MPSIRPRSRRRALRWAIERLEARTLLATITVTSTADTERRDGVTTLREAIASINEGGDIGLGIPADGPFGVDDTINFNIPGTGVHSIVTQDTPMPDIRNPVTIDGLTQPGAAPGNLLIQLDGNRGSGLTLDDVNGTVITGLRIVRYSDSGASGVKVIGGSDNRIEGNVFGGFDFGNRNGVTVENGTGNIVQGNAIVGNIIGSGVVITNAPNTVVADNVIGAQNETGIVVSAPGTRITGNIIGNNSARGMGNVHDGIDLLVTAPHTLIQDNVISGNGGHGIVVDGPDSTIADNRIGTDSTGLSAVPNFGDGILLRVSAADNLVSGNTIAFNGFTGIATKGTGTVRNRITRNSIFANRRLGIDLGNNGVTLNTPNNPLNFPVLNLVEVGTELTVVGVSPVGATIELFVSEPDPSGFGQGKTYLATVVEGSPSDLDPSLGGFRFILPVPVPARATGTVITATSTTSAGTSEFSANIPVTFVTPPVEPPIEPPVEPPIVNPPIEPPVEPPVMPPVQPPIEPPVEPPTEPPPTEPPPVEPLLPPTTVIALHRFGFHTHPTHVVLVFSASLEAVSAQDLVHYKMTALIGGRPVTLRIKSAIYDPTALTVTLKFRRLLPLKFTYNLAVSGVIDVTGQPVVPFTETFGQEALAGPTRV